MSRISEEPSDSSKRSRIAEVLDSALDAVVTIDSSGVVVDWNDQAATMFGWSREEVRGLSLTQTIIPEEMAGRHCRGLERYNRTGHGPVIGQRIRLEAQDRWKNRFPVELSITPIRIDEDAAGFTGFIRDLRVEESNRAKLALTDERLQLILEGSSEGFWDIHLEGDRTTFSGRCSTMLGFQPGELPDVPPPESPRVHPDDREHLRLEWASLLAGGQALLDVVYRMESSNGSWRHVRDVGEVIERDPEGGPRRVTGTRKDVTHETRLEESLLASQRMECMGVVAGGFAHDLNNLLASIGGHAGIASTIGSLPPKVAESLSVIQLAVTRAKVLTENMLALGRSDGVRFCQVDPRATVDATVSLVRPKLHDGVEVSIESDLAPGDRLFADASHFQRALVNLMLNAQDAMTEGGRITVVLRRFENEGLPWLRLTVEDSGSGIAEADLKHIFKPFYTTKQPGKGVGIGLAVVRLFAESSGGSVNARSGSTGGAAFDVELPLNREPLDSRPGEGAGPSEGATRTLLVEDHDLLRPMLTEVLTGFGHAVTACSGAGEALDSSPVEGGALDLLVVDVNLQDGSGLDLVRTIGERTARELPTIFITGNPTALGEQALGPATKVLHKPFGITDLQQEIELVLAEYQSTPDRGRPYPVS